MMLYTINSESQKVPSTNLCGTARKKHIEGQIVPPPPQCAPSLNRLKRLSRKRAKDKPWITTGLKQSIKEKHLLYQKFVFDRTEESKVAYKTFKNK